VHDYHIDDMNRVCLTCGGTKDLTEFSVHSYKENVVYYKNECKSCKLLRDRSYYRNLKLNNYKKIIFTSAKRRAKQKGIIFLIDESDIFIPEFCPVLGIKLCVNSLSAKDNSPSLDRLVPDKGYVKGNCFVISNKANRMKQDSSLDDLENIIKYIKENLK